MPEGWIPRAVAQSHTRQRGVASRSPPERPHARWASPRDEEGALTRPAMFPRLSASLLPLVYSLLIRYGARVRKLTAPEQLYIDFDGFFAACEEQADRRLQGRPLGIIPFAGAVHSCVIAANTMAKRAGVTAGMAVADARRRCPGIALVPQQPDLYTRIHHRIVAAVLDVFPIDAVCSIDEFAATVEPRDLPAALTHQIKQRLRDAVGDHITCSIGYASNRWLAKIAADLDKPDGLTVLHPRDLPGRLLTLDLEDVSVRPKSLASCGMPRAVVGATEADFGSTFSNVGESLIG